VILGAQAKIPSFITALKENDPKVMNLKRVSRTFGVAPIDFPSKSRWKWSKIATLHDELNKLINKYKQTLLNRVERENNNYLLAYKAEMMKVNKNLQVIQNESEKMKKSLLTEDCIKMLEKSLQWFKDEAGQLSSTIEEQDKDISLWREKVNGFNSDIIKLDEELRKLVEELRGLDAISGESLLNNNEVVRPRTVEEKVLKSQLSRTRRIKASQSQNVPKICYIVQYMLLHKEDKAKIIDEVTKYHHQLLSKNKEVTEKLQRKMQSTLFQNINSATSKQLKQTTLLKMFLNSVEDVKAQIYVRRVNNKAQVRRVVLAAGNHKLIKEPTQIKLKSFTATDKRAVFIKFLSNPEVYEKIRSIVNIELNNQIEKSKEQSQGVFDKVKDNVKEGFSITCANDMMEKKKFHASHLSSVPQIPDDLRSTKHKWHRSSTRSSHFRRSRPGTSALRVQRSSQYAKPRNNSVSINAQY